MSNRLLGVLILVGFIGLIVIFYLYFFVYYTSRLVVTSNEAPFSFTLSSIKVPQALNLSCENTGCTYTDISPFSYTLTATKEGYKDIKKDITVPASSTLEVALNFEKEVLLESKKETSSQTGSIKELTQEQKVDLVKRKKTAYAFFEIPSKGYFEFTQVGGKLELSVLRELGEKPKLLGTFDTVAKESITLMQVYGGDSLYIALGRQKYIIDISSVQIFSFTLTPDILYVKVGESTSEFLIVTEVGTYIFDTKNGTPKYFSQFFDFVYSPDRKSIIGFVSNKDEIRRINLGIEEDTNVIIGFERESLDKKILLKTGLQVSKIYQSGTGIIVETKEGEELHITGL